MATVIVQPAGIRAGAQRVNLTAIAHNRLMLLLLLFLAITSILVLRLMWVGVFAGSGHGNAGLSGVPARADIVDRNGVPLARTMDAYSISVRPDRLILISPMIGITALIESSLFADSSVAPPSSMRNPGGSFSRTALSCGSICAETTGACTSSRMSARTVTVGSRFRRLISTSSSP